MTIPKEVQQKISKIERQQSKEKRRLERIKQKADKKQQLKNKRLQQKNGSLKNTAQNQSITTDNQESFTTRASNWIKSQWASVKTSFIKMNSSMKSNFKNNLGTSEKLVEKKWSNVNKHHRNSSKKQTQARKAEQEIHHHQVKAEQLIEDLKNSNDAQVKKSAQRYHRQAKRSKQESEGGREDLEFALRHASQEADRVHKINSENLEKIKAYHQEFLEAQAALAQTQQDLKNDEEMTQAQQSKQSKTAVKKNNDKK